MKLMMIQTMKNIIYLAYKRISQKIKTEELYNELLINN